MKDKQLESVLNSMKGARRAPVPPHLLQRIKAQTFDRGAAIVPMAQLRWIAAAAAVLLLLNAFALGLFDKETTKETMSNNSPYQIQMDYQIYE